MKLSDHPTRLEFDKSRKEIKKENKQLSKDIIELQRKLYAQKEKSLLVIFQGVDASGKDSALRDVFREINPAGCHVFSFKKPTEKEASHDFLWRVHHVCPAKGMIHIFNRSHYEDILVPKVEGYLPDDVIDERFEMMNDFERMLTKNGTTILKFYLHLSKDRQKEKLMKRVNRHDKHYKHSDGDWEVRKKWDQYMEVYEEIFERCNEVPWHIIPSDDNKEKANIIAKIVIEAMEQMDLSFPPLKSKLFTPEYEN
ncbi:PPK2 family polyphosphate kinase [Parvicella tangerina]|uniref:Polyphosphate:AMP/ADP phosphotransferase n=1 Tax=Parvicella tangerina TaxID=2829795 RepID=A0A916JM08_9FLAO|nr:PPK2 family polyphosphate kinase [Parvicella tangerina]CAG5080963.1 Polyphosphate:AMP/ADP phosphotransferase [Parvicella tangerina]